jgi:hypothetical protein|tara:strand:+ start:1538 stop:1747 length:210 start_codon:yes stop_codon:yes gene_type:complete
MDIIQFIRKYQNSLKLKVEDISVSLTSGSISNIEDYRARVGEIQGVTYALDELQALIKKANYDEDTSSS